jgi:hypothetical protein
MIKDVADETYNEYNNTSTDSWGDNFLELCNNSISQLLYCQRQLEKARLQVDQVDGLIIGTGEADFTKGNIEYEFDYDGKIFQLVDAPGIEGDETKCENLVNQAIAKAHLVFYINGTNKKPEAKTAEKIKKYLKRDAEVFAVCNIRGKADFYQFEEDRIDLVKTHKDSLDIINQTTEVLGEILGKDALLGAQSVQGLLGFCATAINNCNISTISNIRNHDLGKAQESYLHEFKDKAEMYRFSKLVKVQDVIVKKLSTFEIDIIESNKRKMTCLIEETINTLGQYLKEHDKITKDIKSVIDTCKKSIDDRTNHFESSYKSKLNFVVNSFFTSIEDGTCDIIKDNYGSKRTIESNINKLISQENKKFSSKIEAIHKSELIVFSDGINTELKRFKEDIERVKFQIDLKNTTMSSVSLKQAIDAIDLNLKDIGGILFNIGSYAVAGFFIGNIVGAIIGALVGVLSSIMNFILGTKNKKIREAQLKARAVLDINRTDFKNNILLPETSKILFLIRTQINDSVLKDLDIGFNKMTDVSTVLRSQITTISSELNTIKGRPYGTV